MQLSLLTRKWKGRKSCTNQNIVKNARKPIKIKPAPAEKSRTTHESSVLMAKRPLVLSLISNTGLARDYPPDLRVRQTLTLNLQPSGSEQPFSARLVQFLTEIIINLNVMSWFGTSYILPRIQHISLILNQPISIISYITQNATYQLHFEEANNIASKQWKELDCSPKASLHI